MIETVPETANSASTKQLAAVSSSGDVVHLPDYIVAKA